MEVPTSRPVPDREFFRIGEVAEILGVPPSAVRFWKDQFSPHIRPQRTGAGQHVFSRRDVQVLALIRHLVHDRDLSIREARDEVAATLSAHDGDASFIELGQADLPLAPPTPEVAPDSAATLDALRAQLDAQRRRADGAEARLAAVRTEVEEMLASL